MNIAMYRNQSIIIVIFHFNLHKTKIFNFVFHFATETVLPLLLLEYNGGSENYRKVSEKMTKKKKTLRKAKKMLKCSLKKCESFIKRWGKNLLYLTEILKIGYLYEYKKNPEK